MLFIGVVKVAKMKIQERIVSVGYSPGHCWYYKLGGKVLYPKQIFESVKTSKYRGYAEDDICIANQKSEPQRSEALRQMRCYHLTKLRSDLTIYRRYALQLSVIRKNHGRVCLAESARDVDMSMSLKHNHLYNGFAHLVYIDESLAIQGDLFTM